MDITHTRIMEIPGELIIFWAVIATSPVLSRSELNVYGGCESIRLVLTLNVCVYVINDNKSM